jgi:hypothetical protein
MRVPSTYREVQRYNSLWVTLTLTAAVLVPLLWQQLGAGSWATLALVGATCASGLLLLGQLTVTVEKDAVRWQFGYVGWPAWEQPFTEVAHVELARGLRLASGIRGSAKHRQYHVRLHSPGVRLIRHDGRTVLLGSAQPEALMAAIQQALGEITEHSGR